MTDVGNASGHEAQAPGPLPLKIFISYRREDTGGEGLFLHDRLAARFGADNVFFDVRSIRTGTEWLREIRARNSTCGAFLSLIGPRWRSSVEQREERGVVEEVDDFVREETETALSRGSGVEVVPVLVGSAVPPDRRDLPPSLRRLGELQAERFRLESADDDLRRLIERLEMIEREERQVAPTLPPVAAAQPAQPRPRTNGVQVGAPSPGETHFKALARHFLERGSVVMLLGTRLGQSGERHSERAPDERWLAAQLAERFELDPAPPDLAATAQYVSMTEGSSPLCEAITEILADESEPGAVHRFLAELPQTMERLQVEPRYQLILATSFDTALERAFQDVNEPYDLAIYMVSGDDNGRFVHFPYRGEPRGIETPNQYGKLPLGDNGALKRTLIVKIHGALDGSIGRYRWSDNYLLTEDQYIDYLSVRPVESVVPTQVLAKLRSSHCLFLGYAMRDWNSRVFIKRIWRGQRFTAQSWAVHPAPDTLEKKLWSHADVELYSSRPADYVAELKAAIVTRSRGAS